MDICEVENCCSPPNFKCLCKEPEIKLCDCHIKEHLILIGNHCIVENYIGLFPEKFILSTQCSSIILKIKAANDKLLQTLNNRIQNLMQITTEFIKENKNMETLYTEVLTYLNFNDKIFKKLEYSQTEEFILKYLKSPNEISICFNEVVARQLKNVDFDSKINEIDKKKNAISYSKKALEEKANNEKIKDKKIEALSKSNDEKNKEIIKVNLEYEKLKKLYNKKCQEIIVMCKKFEDCKSQNIEEINLLNNKKNKEISDIGNKFQKTKIGIFLLLLLYFSKNLLV